MRLGITKSENEVVVGEDQYGIPIIDCPDVVVDKPKEKVQRFGRFWYKCPECSQDCWHEDNGKTYYHLLRCSFSNNIGYGTERDISSTKHAINCSCYTCSPPRENKK